MDDEEFEPAPLTVAVLRWAQEFGAATLGEAYDLLDQFEASNDVPEVLGDDGRVEDVRADVELGLELAGPDADLAALV